MTKAVDMQHQSALRDRDLREATLLAEIEGLKEELARAKEVVPVPETVEVVKEAVEPEEVVWEDERDEEIRRLRAEASVLREQVEYCQRYHEQVIARQAAIIEEGDHALRRFKQDYSMQVTRSLIWQLGCFGLALSLLLYTMQRTMGIFNDIY